MPAIGGIAGVATAIGTATSVIGTIVQGRALREQGRNEQAAAEFEALQLERAAAEEIAAGGREAAEVQRETQMMRGNSRANAGAGGVGGIGTAYLDAEVERLGRYRRDLVFYGGIERGKGRQAQANTRRIAGRAALDGSRAAAIGTILGGVGSSISSAASFYSTFGQRQPITAPTDGVPPWLVNGGGAVGRATASSAI